MPRLRPLLVVLLGFLAAGCHRDDESVRAAVQRLALAEGAQAARQADQVAREGRRALPFIEAALHTADDVGRKNLVGAVRRLEDAEAVPLLMHLAAYDPSAPVRAEALETLRVWSAMDGDRGEKARSALRRLDELMHREEAG